MTVAVAEQRHTPRFDAGRLALAAAGPVAIGGIVAARAGDLSPLALTPAIVFGVVAATSPALYIAIVASKEPITLGSAARAMLTAIMSFGVALAGLLLPAVFLSLSSVSSVTTIVVTSVALGAAAALAMLRLAGELAPRTFSGGLVCFAWVIATLGIAGRMWFDLATEVLL